MTCELYSLWEQSAPFALVSELPDANWLDYRTALFTKRGRGKEALTATEKATARVAFSVAEKERFELSNRF